MLSYLFLRHLLFFNFLNFLPTDRIYYRLLVIDFNFYNNAFSGKDYNYYNGKYLNEKDKSYILKTIPSSGLKLFFKGNLDFLTFTYRFWELTLSLNLKSKGRIEKEIFELIFWGNQLNRFYQIKESGGEVYVFGEIKNRFCLSLKKSLNIFWAINYFDGYYYLQTKDNYVKLLTTSSFLNFYGELNYRKSSGGKGFGIDLGFFKKIGKERTFQLIIENLCQHVYWCKENYQGKIILKIDSLNFNRLKTGNCYSLIKEEKKINNFATNLLPTIIILSLENQLKNYLKINFGLNLAMKEYFKISSCLNYQPFNFLNLAASLDFYFPISNNLPFNYFSLELGGGLSLQIKKFDIFILQKYYDGILLTAKGFSFKLGCGYTFASF
uniref:DUF5723 domain-containing protein n=1 Tax=candidate division WOR-3 bacterium TaxID=2052148 RepID=A0A7V3ZUG9_UNCW3